MKMTLTCSMFLDAFHHAGRKDQFSYEGLRALFDYLEDVDPDYDLDVVGLCCDYCEQDLETLLSEFDLDIEEDASEEEKADKVRDYLNYHTSLIWDNGTDFLYASF